MFHFDINKSHVNIIMWQVNIFYLACNGECRGSKINYSKPARHPHPKPRVRGLYHKVLSNFSFKI